MVLIDLGATCAACDGRRCGLLVVNRAVRRGEVLGVPTVCLFEVAQLEERGRIKLRLPFCRSTSASSPKRAHYQRSVIRSIG